MWRFITIIFSIRKEILIKNSQGFSNRSCFWKKRITETKNVNVNSNKRFNNKKVRSALTKKSNCNSKKI